MSTRQPADANSILIELEEISRAYGPGKIRQVDTPGLTLIAQQLELTRDELIAECVSKIDDDRYRSTADTLLIRPEVRQSNFTQRTSLAAAEFGIGVDAFRRVPKQGGLSTRSLVLLEAAQQAADIAPTAATENAASKQTPVLEALSTSDSEPHSQDLLTSNRRAWLAPIMALAAFVALGAFAIQRVPDSAASISLAGEVDVTMQCVAQGDQDSVALPDPSSAGWLCRAGDGVRETADIEQACHFQYGTESSAQNLSGNNSSWRCVTHFPIDSDDDCPVAAGAFNPSTSDIHSPFASSFRHRYEEAGGHEVLGCPTQLLHHWVAGPMQELETEDGQKSAIIALTPDAPILLQGTAFGAFNRVKGITGELVGFPTSEPYVRTGIYYVDLSSGGSLIAATEDAPFYWVPPVVAESWAALGGVDSCVGLPISDPYSADGAFKQDFEDGVFSLSVLTGELFHTGDNC